jgi:hypothetical protein
MKSVITEHLCYATWSGDLRDAHRGKGPSLKKKTTSNIWNVPEHDTLFYILMNLHTGGPHAGYVRDQVAAERRSDVRGVCVLNNSFESSIDPMLEEFAY